ncbi:MAG: hypothetical protein KBD01_18690 [Acidobacteria bacterium]|nr:hypothetical protein [Acidobacteriota bacterium]
MSTAAERSELTFTAPGPGTWEQDPAHFPRAITPWTAEAFPPGFARGFAEGTRRYGLLFSHLDAGVVNGFIYYRVVPAAEVHGEAEVPRRFEAAREAIERRLWREDLALWDNEMKADSFRRNRALQSVDLAALSDRELARHVERCFENEVEMVYRHHKFTITAIFPVGLYVAAAKEWTGLSNSELLGLLRGSTPLSNGIAAAELQEVVDALRAENVTLADFAGVPPATIVERLRTRPGAVGASVRRYLDACGAHAMSGYDVADLTTEELPDTIVQAFFGGARDTDPQREAAELAARTAEVRAKVPAQHRAEFDELLAEARLINRLRDERGVHNDLWAFGIARRALLEAGRRLALRGSIERGELVFEARPVEIVALLDGRTGPASDELRERARRRLSLTRADVPPVLGDPPSPPPPIDGLPEHARRAAAAIQVSIGELLGEMPAATSESRLSGRAVSPGVYEGTARLVLGPADFNRLQQGDVLVTASTNAAFNVVLPLLGAIVTDRGALLSHAAIVAREYGIPAVVHTASATTVIPDGARVRVDGMRGTVEVLR